MDAGGLDVLHQATDHHPAFTVAEGIDIHLDRIFEVFINQHRMVGCHLHRLHHVAIELLLVVHHLHGPTAEHITGTHDHGVADAGGHRTGLLIAAGQAVMGLADFQLPQDRLELFPIFSSID